MSKTEDKKVYESIEMNKPAEQQPVAICDDCLQKRHCSKNGCAKQPPTQQALREAAEKVINELWSIIDDIDTYGDMAKSDDAAYRQLIEKRQADRWKTGITTDGYTLNIDAALRGEGEKK